MINRKCAPGDLRFGVNWETGTREWHTQQRVTLVMIFLEYNLNYILWEETMFCRISLRNEAGNDAWISRKIQLGFSKNLQVHLVRVIYASCDDFQYVTMLFFHYIQYLLIHGYEINEFQKNACSSQIVHFIWKSNVNASKLIIINKLINK